MGNLIKNSLSYCYSTALYLNQQKCASLTCTKTTRSVHVVFAQPFEMRKMFVCFSMRNTAPFLVYMYITPREFAIYRNTICYLFSDIMPHSVFFFLSKQPLRFKKRKHWSQTNSSFPFYYDILYSADNSVLGNANFNNNKNLIIYIYRLLGYYSTIRSFVLGYRIYTACFRIKSSTCIIWYMDSSFCSGGPHENEKLPEWQSHMRYNNKLRCMIVEHLFICVYFGFIRHDVPTILGKKDYWKYYRIYFCIAQQSSNKLIVYLTIYNVLPINLQEMSWLKIKIYTFWSYFLIQLYLYSFNNFDSEYFPLDLV